MLNRYPASPTGRRDRFPRTAQAHRRRRRRRARLAYDVYIHRLRSTKSAYLALLGRTDVITFTAGGGERRPGASRRAGRAAALGIELDQTRNTATQRAARRISADTSPITVLVVPTNEELAIARACAQVI